MQKITRIVCAVPFVIKGRDYTPEAGTIRAVIPNGGSAANVRSLYALFGGYSHNSEVFE